MTGPTRKRPAPDRAQPRLDPSAHSMTSRQRAILLGGVGALVLALLAGLLTWVNSASSPSPSPNSPSSETATSQRDLKPFREAVDDLADAPGLRYKDTSAQGITDNEITVTAGGSQFGTTSSGQHDHDRDVLRIGGKKFTRWQEDPAPRKDVADLGVSRV